MKPEKRKTTPAILGLFGAKAEVRFQPKGVIGIISPWNFPVNLTFTPLAGVLAAGNRAMIKPSEFTPATSALMAEMFAQCVRARRDRGGDWVDPKPARNSPACRSTTSSSPAPPAIAEHVMRAAAREPDSPDTGAGRQESCDRQPVRGHEDRRRADHERQDAERRTDLPSAGLRAGAARTRCSPSSTRRAARWRRCSRRSRTTPTTPRSSIPAAFRPHHRLRGGGEGGRRHRGRAQAGR